MSGAPAVVVVTHQTCEEALGCLATLPAAGAHEVVVVDSGSTDGTAAAVRRAGADLDALEVTVLELENVGFGRAANAGIRRCRSEAVAVCNADVRWDPGSLTALARVLRTDPDLAAVGPAVRYPSGRHQASARRLPDVRTALGHAVLARLAPGNRFTWRYRALDTDPAQPRDADWLSGCALLLRRSAVDAVRGFDPGYFLYLEDVDLGMRLRAQGWRLRFHPAAGVEHRVGASTSRQRIRARLAHARSLDRFLTMRVLRGPGRLARLPLRVALAAWVVVSLVADRLAGARRSSTGEPVRALAAGDHRGVRGPGARRPRRSS